MASWLDPESEENRDRYNDWIYQAYHEQPWSSVHRIWREGFLRFLELGQAIPEDDLLAAGKYPWLEGYPLYAVLQGSYEHHDEHLDPLLAWHTNIELEQWILLSGHCLFRDNSLHLPGTSWPDKSST